MLGYINTGYGTMWERGILLLAVLFHLCYNPIFDRTNAENAVFISIFRIFSDKKM